MKTLKNKCKTCPWTEGSPNEFLKEGLEETLLQCSRICHSTGSNAINESTGKPEALCRGARDIQLQDWHNMGFIETPTDEAWAAKLKEVNQATKQSNEI